MTMTAFCSARLDGPGGYIFLDGNGKVTGGNGTFAAPRPNAFSIVQVEDCPFRTPTCEAACYVHGLESNAPNTHALYRHNSRMLRQLLANPVHRTVWAHLLADWITDNAAAGFRWHVSGDITSELHAKWIAMVCDASPDVRHWIYTRSYPYIGPLLEVAGSNLALNLSCDRDNLWLARRFADKNGLRLAYMVAGDEPRWVDDGELRKVVAPELPEGSVLFPDYALRGRDLDKPTDAPWWQSLTPAQRRQVCPVDFFGGSPSLRCGPCKKCLR